MQGKDPQALQTNFSSDHPSTYYAEMYRHDNLTGGHIIMLGPGNEQAAIQALRAWPDGMQVGGGITVKNAAEWLNHGASHVIVTSYVFHDGILDLERLLALCRQVGKDRIVLDLSCRWRDDGYYVVTNRWQNFTSLRINGDILEELAQYCDEFLVHAVDVEGMSMGVDERLINLLAAHTPIPTTYAGGVSSMEDLEMISIAGQGRLDFTVGSALDIFGGTAMKYENVVAFHEHT